MTEWTVVAVIMVLSGLVATLVKPMLSLNTSMTKLTMANERLSEEFQGLTGKNSEAHEQILRHQDEQDKQLFDHNRRITRLEDKR